MNAIWDFRVGDSVVIDHQNADFGIVLDGSHAKAIVDLFGGRVGRVARIRPSPDFDLMDVAYEQETLIGSPRDFRKAQDNTA